MLYFDHNATTFVAPEVAGTLSLGLREVYGNASSTHRAGQLARQHLESSRATIARSLDAIPSELVFTSGGTESNNLAILGLVRNASSAQKHVVTTTIEHPSVLECCRELEREGVDVTYVPVDRSGVVSADIIRRSLQPHTVLVSVMHANNEIGTIQPIREIARYVRAHREAGHHIFFHSDGVQALGKIEVNVRDLGVDLYSLSGHKLFAPKGIGALYVRNKVALRGVQFGGRQERERRAGTENVPGAMAFARAIELCSPNHALCSPNHALCSPDHAMHVAGLRDRFERDLVRRIPEMEVNGSRSERLPNTSNILFHGVSGEALVIALDMQGIAVSTGSACSSGAVEPSHVLLAIGHTPQEARSCVRFSFSRYNTADEIIELINAVTESVERLRTTARWEKPVVA